MKQICSFFVSAMLLVAVLSTGSCSLFEEDEDDPVNPVLTPSEVTLADNEEATVDISEGVAPYQLSGGNANVASVTINGSSIDIKALNAGSSNVTVKGSDGGSVELPITVTQSEVIKPELTPSTVSVRVDDVATVAVSNGVVPYQLSGGDASVASVAINGSNITVKGLKVGTSTVTVSGKNGGTAQLTVNVAEKLAVVEEDRYKEFVTSELEDALVNDLGLNINRGTNPPNITGFYRMDDYCTKSTIANDSYVGRLINHFKIKFFNQKEIDVSLEAFEVTTGTNDFIAQHDAIGTFICGEGNNFSVFFTEKVTSTKGTCTILSVFSGTLEKDGTGKVIGIKNFQNAFIMKDRNNVPDTIDNNEGRLFEDSYVDVITKEAYETINNKPSTQKASVRTNAASMVSAAK